MVGLTTKAIEGLKPQDTRFSVRDEVTPGLELRISEGGAKTFAIRYTLNDGTRRRMNIGRWPATDLKSAREAALAAMAEVAKGGDPALKRINDRHTARSRTVRSMADLAEALFDAGGVRQSTMQYRRWLWAKHLAPRFGRSRIDDLAPGAVRREIRDIGLTAGPTTGNRALGLLQRLLNFAVEEEHLTLNPLAKVKPLFGETSRARVLADAEIRRLWDASCLTLQTSRQGQTERDDLGVSRSMAVAILLCLLTGQRGGEVIGMRRSELDLPNRTWLLPAERSKSKREHLIPLSATVVDLIQEALAFTNATSIELQTAGPVFPSPRDQSQPVERLSLSRAMARLTKFAEIENATPHDLRRTMATFMASERLSVLTEVVSRVLNHAPPGLGVTGIYNRHAYVAEKRSALERWERLVLEIVGELQHPENVVELGRVAGRPPS